MKNLILLIIIFISTVKAETPSRVFTLEGPLILEKGRAMGFLESDCSTVNVFTNEWEIVNEKSFSEMEYQTQIVGANRVVTPLVNYHMSLRPKKISEVQISKYKKKVEDLIKVKMAAEEKQVAKGLLDKEETLYFGRCKKIPHTVQMIDADSLQASTNLFSIAESFNASVFINPYARDIELEVTVQINPLEDRGHIHNIIEKNAITSHLKIINQAVAKRVKYEGYMLGSFAAYSEFAKKTYYERTCWTTRHCRKFGPFKRCRTSHHCKRYPVERVVFKEMSSTGKIEVSLAGSEDLVDEQKDEFYDELMAKFVMTNFNGKVSDQASGHITYKGGALKRASKIQNAVAKRVFEFHKFPSFLSPKIVGGEVDLSEINDFIKSKKFKCLIKNGLTELDPTGPCQ